MVGEDGADMLAILDDIARGKMTTTVMVDGVPLKIGPSIKERREAAVALLDRGFGKPTTPVDLAGADGGPLVVNVIRYAGDGEEGA